MCPTTHQEIPVNFIMDDGTGPGIEIGGAPDVIAIEIKVMTEKEPNLARRIGKIAYLDFFDVDV
jgi:hypothetical protein